MPEGLHLGRGGDIVVLILVLVADIDEGGGGGGVLPPPPGDLAEKMDDASLSIVPLSYSSSSQTSIRRAISKMRDGPPDRVVRLGVPVAVVVIGAPTPPLPSSSSRSSSSLSPPSSRTPSPPIPRSSSIPDPTIRPIPVDCDFPRRPLDSLAIVVLDLVVVAVPVPVLG